MTFIGSKADNGAIHRVQVLSFNDDPRASAVDIVNMVNTCHGDYQRCGEGVRGALRDVPVKAAVGQHSCDLWLLFVVKHLGCEDRRLVDENT